MKTKNLFVIALGLAATLIAPRALATANYVYHERTGNDVTAGNANTCGGPQVFVPVLNPSSAQSYLLRFKVEFQFFTDTVKVYYTTDGSTPAGAFGAGSGTTLVVNGAYQCTFTQGADTVDVCNATIPAQPAGTVVKYIVSAWHSGGGPEIFANSGTCVACGDCETSTCATLFQYTVVSTTDLYWDSNGTTPGAGTTPTGTWGTSTFWSTIVDGTLATAGWTAGKNAVFSAGSDATGTFTVTLSGTQTAGNLTHEEGTITISGGTSLNIGGGVSGQGLINVAPGRTLTISSVVTGGDNTSRLTKNNSGTLVLSGNNTFTGGITVNGGVLSHSGEASATPGAVSTTGLIPATVIPAYIILNGSSSVFRSTRVGVGVTFLATPKGITLNGGGTLEVTDVTAGDLNIYAGVIAGTGPLVKDAGGVLSVTGLSTYSGSTIVKNGILRIRTTGQRLPAGTDMVVMTPGIFDVANLGQTVNSLTGDGTVSTTTSTAGILTVAGSTSPAAFTGIISGSGSLTHSGSGTLTLAGLNTYTGKFTNSAGVVTVNAGGTLCGAVCDVTVTAGVVNLNNVAQTIENLLGAGGTINLAAGHTLTINPASSSTYSGTIAGAGGVTKTSTSTEILAGANTYDGNTLISGGRLQVNNASGLGSTVGYTEVGTAGELLFDGAANSFTISEPIRVAGLGLDGGAITVQNNANMTISGPVTLVGDTTNTVSSTGTVLYNNPNAFASLANQNLGLQGGAGAGGGGTISGVIALGTGGITKLQGGTWAFSGANTYDGPTTILAGSIKARHNSALGSAVGSTTLASGANLSVDGTGLAIAEPISSLIGSGISSGGALRNLANNNSWTGPITLGTGGARINSDAGLFTLAGGISGVGNILSVGGVGSTRVDVAGVSGAGTILRKDGTGTLTLAVPSTYDGGTTVSNGVLVVANATGSATGPGTVAVYSPGILAGSGSIAGAVTVNGILAPGTSPGTLSTGDESWNSGGTYVWEVNDAAGTQGADPGYDFVNITGALTFGATPGSKFAVILTTLTPGNLPGSAANFNNAQDYSWVIATASGGITDFDESKFAVITTNFSNAIAANGSFRIASNGNNIEIHYVHSPLINAQPANQAAECGTGNASFSVGVSGSPTLGYQWRLGGIDLVDGGSYSGATSGTLTINPTLTATAGNYDVVITNNYGSVTSTFASLTISDTVAPIITCPANVLVQCLGDVPAPSIPSVTVTDACDASPIVAFLGDLTNGVNPMIITRTYAASDSANNTNTCTQTITVQDTIAPVASCKNIVVTLVGGNVSITPADVNNGSSDNCALNLVSVQPSTFTIANLGPNNVTLTVSDNAEHTNTCVAVVTVNALSTNYYVIQVSDLATGKPEFSPPHGTGTNSFGYDWDSAPPDDTFGAPVGYGDSSFSASVGQAGATEPDRYRTFRIGLRTLFGHNVNVGQVARISYHTKKPAPASEIDWRLTIYTTSQGAGDVGSFYRSRLQATPSNALNLNAPASQWNTWSTAAGDNEFQFKDNRADFMTENVLWSEIIGGPVTRGASTWNWTAEEVMMIDITLGANSGGGTGLSQIDGVQIELTTGEVADLNLQQNTQLTRYNIQPSDLATGKPQFSPPHGTGTNPFGYDWDSAAPDTAAGAPAGYGCSSYSATVTQAGATEPDRYRTFRIGLRTLFGHNVNVGQVASITYQTKKPMPQTEVDWRLTIYTTPEGAGDAGSFYRSRIQATPSNSLGLNAPANQWNTWTTGPGGVNQFQFLEKRADFMTENMLWSEITGGPVTRGATTWDWTAEEVMMIDITLGANSGGGDATSQLDAVQIRLADGSIADINLEALPYSNVYVDDDYSGSPNGTVVTFPNGAGGPSHVIGCDAFATIQGGIDAVASGGTVNVAPGSYLEDVAVNKTVSVLGAGAGQSLVYGPANGPAATFQVTATGVLIEGFTITRDGNNPTDWNGPLNSAGVAIQGLSANATVRNCWLEGNRTAIDINLSAGNVIASNVLTNNRTGLIFRNDCQNNIVTNNAIVDNWTVGVLWLDTGISALAQGTVVSRNNISGNWYGQIVDRRVSAGTFDLWNCSGNWLGSSTLTITSANSAEPGYAAQIPVAFGGSAVPPGGAPSLAGPGVANIDYTPWLDVGTDTSIAFGFQGDFSTVHVDDNSPQVGPVGLIQEGLNSVSGSTVLIAAGSYTENIVISSKVTLIGAGSGAGAGDTVITAADTSLPVVLIDDAGGTGSGDRLTLKDLRVQGSTLADGIRVRATTAPRAFYRFDNVASVQNPNGAGLQVEGPQNVSDIEVANCILDNNNYGLTLSTTIPVFNGLSVTGGEIKDNSTLGLIVNPLGSDATDASTDYSNITVDGTAFANNGNAIFAGSGHLVFFRFNGNATVKNVTLSGPTWSPIQFRGEGVDATPSSWQSSGTVLLQNVTIGGSGIRPGLYIQDYSDVSGFTFDNVTLATYLPPDVSGPNGFFAQAMQVRHTGAIKMNLGKLTLPSTVTFSGFLPVSGFYALALTAPGGAQATCDTVILGVATTQGLEDAVFDGDDTALMAALSIPSGAIGDVAFPALSVTCPGNVTQGCATPGGATITFPPATAAGDCVPGTPSCLPASGSTFAIGTTVVTCSVTDARGITANCTFNVTVLADTNAPAINCPAPIVVNADNGQCGKSNVIFTVTATDDCDATPTVVSTPASGSTFPVGTTTVTSVVTDDAGNTNSCSFTVTVIDDQPPLIVCSTNIVVTNSFGLCSAVVTFTTNASDNCTVTNLVSTPPSGSAFPVGTTTVTNIATDASGNSSTCTFTITVIDNQAPTLTCPTNITVAANSGLCSATNVNLGSPAASDNCAVTSLTNNGPAIYLAGTTPVVWSASDASGHTTTCTQMVTVLDTQPPTITCSTNRLLEATSPAGTPVFFSTTASDNCSSVTTFCTMSSGDLFPVGTTTVQCAAYDSSFNAAVCIFNVTIVDTIPPTISCPTNLTANCNRTNGAMVQFTVGATDLGDSNVIVTVNPPSGSTFPPGTTTVNCTASDHSGNTNTCSFTITVVDTPVLLSIQRQSTNVVLAWPVTCTLYQLQETPNLSPPVNWVPSQAPLVVDFTNVVTIPHGRTNRFFRLKQP